MKPNHSKLTFWTKTSPIHMGFVWSKSSPTLVLFNNLLFGCLAYNTPLFYPLLGPSKFFYELKHKHLVVPSTKSHDGQNKAQSDDDYLSNKGSRHLKRALNQSNRAGSVEPSCCSWLEGSESLLEWSSGSARSSGCLEAQISRVLFCCGISFVFKGLVLGLLICARLYKRA